MNAVTLAKESSNYAAQYVETLAPAIVRQLRLAFVANWLNQQDADVLPRAAVTAVHAIDLINMDSLS